MQQRQRRHQTAHAHQEVSIRHSLDEVAGGVVVQQRCTVKDKYHNNVARNNQHHEEHNNNHFQEAKIDGLQIANGQETEGPATLVANQRGVHLEHCSDLSTSCSCLLPAATPGSCCHCGWCCVCSNVKTGAPVPRAAPDAAAVHCLQHNSPLNPAPRRSRCTGTQRQACQQLPRRTGEG